MARNESVARMVMLLCFGTAILSLAVHWQIKATQGRLEQATSSVLRQNSTRTYSKGSSTVGLGETALGASVPSSRLKPAAVKPDPKLETVSKYVASATDAPKKMRLVTPGQRQNQEAEDQLKLSTGMASDQTQVVVVLSDRRVYVYRHNEVIASYPIAVGKKGWETPTGTFEVMHMQHHPIWRHPITGKVFEAGTDSPLGDRWVGFWSDGRNEIGFHGTPDIDLIGAAVSHGCLRMRNADVRSLYDQVSLGTPVLVRD
ncbi:L,D-transpeptidase [Cylindrospermum sp. FACHB-282]|uniref:L,D-transpeptidase n=1 Tax=Cylindrospermum sp. FACHB-282 TaxID=2692794 RepID=UPI0016890D70|nr:L,D-transpeptidase [Cylindrospermum sp. FACHB-282]MBD2386527.1 L,D-transpeptidase [Cylindrospermum sp. FACHB-282]